MLRSSPSRMRGGGLDTGERVSDGTGGSKAKSTAAPPRSFAAGRRRALARLRRRLCCGSPFQSLSRLIGIPNSCMSVPHIGVNTKRASPGRKSLADALFTRTQQRVLGVLFGQPDRSFYASELIRMAGTGSGAAQRELARLENSGLLVSRRVGHQKHYQCQHEVSALRRTAEHRAENGRPPRRILDSAAIDTGYLAPAPIVARNMPSLVPAITLPSPSITSVRTFFAGRPSLAGCQDVPPSRETNTPSPSVPANT